MARNSEAELDKMMSWNDWWRDYGRHNCFYEPLTPKRAKELMKLAFEVGREVRRSAPLSEEK